MRHKGEMDLLQAQREADLLAKDVKHIRGELLKTRGLMTSRGVFEHVLRGVFKRDGQYFKGGFTASKTVEVIRQFVEFPVNYPNLSADTVDLVQMVRNCFPDLDEWEKIYSMLSNRIHGYPWDGDCVHVVADAMPQATCCVIKKIAEWLELGVKEISTADVPDEE